MAQQWREGVNFSLVVSSRRKTGREICGVRNDPRLITSDSHDRFNLVERVLVKNERLHHRLRRRRARSPAQMGVPGLWDVSGLPFPFRISLTLR